MIDPNDMKDRLVDENLRKIGGMLSLPPGATEIQKQRWKNAPLDTRTVRRESAPHRGGGLFHNPRFLTVAGSALAASIVVGAFVLISSQQTVVQAATILRSFRQGLVNGFELTIENVGSEGVLVNGVVLALMKPPVADAPEPLSPRDLEPQSIYVNVRVTADEANDDVAGLDLQAAAGLSDDQQWLFVKPHALPRKLLSEQPLAAALLHMVRGGVVLELDGVIEQLRHKRDGRPTPKPRVSISASRSDSDESADHGIKIELGDGTDLGDAALNSMVRDFLYGRAGGAQLSLLVSLFEKSARVVRIDEVRRGEHVLTAADFTKGEDPQSNDYDTLAAMELEIRYQEGQGVKSAEVRHIGPSDGTIRIAIPRGGPDRALFDKQRFLDDGAALWNLSNLPMIEQLLKIGG